ncbi:hypothetical protein [Liquorilactobacillus satsumensis]|uniref:hypothetical protein n=1 Tax=Liquorilactobacillus satsumensis TaxID=259059 RepID=UPI0039ECAA48
MIFTKTKMSTDSAECLTEMRQSNDLLCQKLEILGNKKLSIIHIDQSDQVVSGKKIYYLTFVYLMEDKCDAR